MFPLFPFICYITFLHLKHHVLFPEGFFKVFRWPFLPLQRVQVIFILKKSSGWHWLAPDWHWEVLGGACERQTLCEALPSLPLDVWHHCSLGSQGPTGQWDRSVPKRRPRHRALSYLSIVFCRVSCGRCRPPRLLEASHWTLRVVLPFLKPATCSPSFLYLDLSPWPQSLSPDEEDSAFQRLLWLVK